MAEEETCCFCDQPTGRPGRADDSLYIEADDVTLGPMCPDCWSKIAEVVQEDLESEAGKLRKRIGDLQATVDKLALFAVWVADGPKDAWIWQLPSGWAPTVAAQLLYEWQEGQEDEDPAPPDTNVSWYSIKAIPGGDACAPYTEFELVEHQTGAECDAEAAKENPDG